MKTPESEERRIDENINNRDTLPPKVVWILDSFSREENDYDSCRDLEASLLSFGYTIEWGLDAEPFNLRTL